MVESTEVSRPNPNPNPNPNPHPNPNPNPHPNPNPNPNQDLHPTVVRKLGKIAAEAMAAAA